MRIALAYFQHEANTFSPVTTSLPDFEIVSGAEMLRKLNCCQIFAQAEAQLVPTVYANALPSGPIDYASYLNIQNQIIGQLDDRLDGIWLHLHGAMEVQGQGSGEAALLAAIRQKVGMDIPVAVVLDFHANNSAWITQYANIVCGYRTAPHVDIAAQEQKAARLLLHSLQTGIRPRSVMVRVPVVSNGDVVTTSADPMAGFMKKLADADHLPGIWSISAFNGQPWADVAGAGGSVVVSCTDQDAGLELAQKLAAALWEIRGSYQFPEPLVDPADAIRQAAVSKNPPVFITDTGDNVTGGAAGDQAAMLELLLKAKVSRALLGGITDAAAVAACRHNAPGDQVQLRLGASLDKRGKSLSLQAEVKAHGTIPFWQDDGSCDCVVVHSAGVDIVITEKRCAFTSPASFRRLGLSPEEYQIIVVKLGYLFPELQKIAGGTIMALTAGATCENITQLEFSQIPRPMYPFDQDINWMPTAQQPDTNKESGS